MLRIEHRISKRLIPGYVSWESYLASHTVRLQPLASAVQDDACKDDNNELEDQICYHYAKVCEAAVVGKRAIAVKPYTCCHKHGQNPEKDRSCHLHSRLWDTRKPSKSGDQRQQDNGEHNDFGKKCKDDRGDERAVIRLVRSDKAGMKNAEDYVESDNTRIVSQISTLLLVLCHVVDLFEPKRIMM